MLRAATLMLAACLALNAAARADGMAPPPRDQAPANGWTYQFTPYGWVPWVQGDATVRGRHFDVYASPVNVLETLDFAWMSYMQAKNGPLTLFADVIYGHLSSSGSIFRSASANGISATLGATLSADYQFWIVEAGGMYEIMRWQNRGPAALEMLAGGRYWHQQLDVDLALAGTVNVDGLTVSGNRAIASSGGVDWVDPFVGARLRWQPAPGEEVSLRGDVGGFGAGSKFTWQALAAYNWRLCTQGALTLDGYVAYRALSVDYAQGSGTDRYVFDVIQHGPVVGVTGRF
jgi:hypothetical protein